MRYERSAAILPVAGAAVWVIGDVGDEECREQRTSAGRSIGARGVIYSCVGIQGIDILRKRSGRMKWERKGSHSLANVGVADAV